MGVAIAASSAPLWNSLEIAKIAIGSATPILVAFLGFMISRRLKTLEAAQWGTQRIVEKRLRVFDDVAPKLNRLLCYFNYVGTWKETTPPEVLRLKRELDAIIHINSPLFGADFVPRYNSFIETCFETFSGWGEDAKLITGFKRRKDAAGDNWRPEWEEYFSKSSTPTREHSMIVREVYNRFMSYFAQELGVGLIEVAMPAGLVPYNIE